MRDELSGRVRDAVEAFRSNFVNPNLRRAQLAFGAAWAAEWAFTVGLSVVAYRDGGAAAVGLVALLRMVPSALLAPAASALADRMRRERVLIWASVLRAGATALAAAVLTAGGPLVAVYALAVASTIAVTPFRAAHSALLPSLCNTAQELTSSNVVRGMLDSMSVLLGPLAAAALLAWTSAEAVFVATAAVSGWAALLLVRLDYEQPPHPTPAGSPRLWQETRAGLRMARRDRDVALVIGLTSAQTFTRGCLTVLTVVVAIDLLGAGEAGVGVLTAALGAGAVAGSLVTGMLSGEGRLARWLGLSVALWGLPLCLIAAVPERWASLAALGTIGLANAALDVALFTLVARLVPDEILARTFGVLEALIALTVGVGAVLTPVVIDAAGTRGALLILGLVGPAAALLAWRRLGAMDATLGERDSHIDLLRRVSLLRPLPMPTIEQLARHAQHCSFALGATVCHQGEVGDRYYVIADGSADVMDGERFVTTLQAGEGFGEIALLRDIPRTTTVLARTDLAVYAIAREDFTPAVTGFSAAATAAATTVAGRLADLARPAAT